MAVKIKYFVHGTTTDNASKLCSGWKEAMLNDLYWYVEGVVNDD